VPGLYAAGETTGNFCSNISGAATWGWISAEHAVEQIASGALSDTVLEASAADDKLELCSRMMERKNGADWEEANLLLQQIMSDYAPPASEGKRSETMLRAGIAYLEELRRKMDDELAARCSHTLMRALEVYDLADLGESVLHACRERKESRGQHMRADYAFTNPLLNGLFLTVFREDGKVKTAWRQSVMAE